MRVFRNPYVMDWEKRPQDIQAFPAQSILSARTGVLGGIGGQMEGLDKSKSCFAMGQGAGSISDAPPAGDIVRRMVREAADVLQRTANLVKEMR
jgi:enoyl-[acyl-carrier protein] reductase II